MLFLFPEVGPDSAPVTPQAPASTAGMASFLSTRTHPGAQPTPEQNGAAAHGTAPEKQPAPPGTAGMLAAAQPQLQSFLSGMSSQNVGPLLAATAPKLASSLHSSHTESSTAITVPQHCHSHSPQLTCTHTHKHYY